MQNPVKNLQEKKLISGNSDGGRSYKRFRNLVQYGLESGDRAVVHETLISVPILFPPDFVTRYGSKVIGVPTKVKLSVDYHHFVLNYLI